MERNYFDHKPRGCWPIYMKQFKKQLVLVVLGFAGCLVLAGCVSQEIMSQETKGEMTRRNEAALKKARSRRRSIGSSVMKLIAT